MDGKALRDKLVGSDDERAVSPVIGVILMVAITVILAAVIATLVMDIGEDQNTPAQGGADYSFDGSGAATISIIDEGNLQSVHLRGCADEASILTDVGAGDTIEIASDGSYNEDASGTIDSCTSGDTLTVVGENSNGDTTQITSFETPSASSWD